MVATVISFSYDYDYNYSGNNLDPDVVVYYFGQDHLDDVIKINFKLFDFFFHQTKVWLFDFTSHLSHSGSPLQGHFSGTYSMMMVLFKGKTLTQVSNFSQSGKGFLGSPCPFVPSISPSTITSFSVIIALIQSNTMLSSNTMLPPPCFAEGMRS